MGIRKDGSSVTVRFGGEVVRHQDETGRFWFTQEGGECVRAVPCDVPIVGYGGKPLISSAWSAEPCEEDFDLDAFNAEITRVPTSFAQTLRPSQPSSIPMMPVSMVVSYA